MTTNVSAETRVARQAAVDRRLAAMTYAERLEALTKLEVRVLKIERQYGIRPAMCDCQNGPAVMGGLCARCRAACEPMAVAVHPADEFTARLRAEYAAELDRMAAEEARREAAEEEGS